MKVSTDSLLLGAWTPLGHGPNSILDIGTGCGILALQMAQRSDALILDAIEPDADSYGQAVGNFENSPWRDRLFCYHCSLRDFMEEPEDQYDLIISNPPFYTTGVVSPNAPRAKARHTGSLDFESILKAARIFLAENGMISLILPFPEENGFIALAKSHGLFPYKICRVNDRSDSPIKRSMLTFGFEERNPTVSRLTLKNATGEYSTGFKNLLREFYLEF